MLEALASIDRGQLGRHGGEPGADGYPNLRPLLVGLKWRGSFFFLDELRPRAVSTDPAEPLLRNTPMPMVKKSAFDTGVR